MKQVWRIRTKKVEDFQATAAQLGVSPFLVRLLCNRGLQTEEEMRYYLYGTIDKLHSPYLLRDAKKAMEILLEKIMQGKRIRVIGDYDADGVTATFILKRGMSLLGADVSSDIPERMADGYGLNERLIRAAMQDGVDTIITCDNGIAAKNEIKLAKDMGMTVLVTDHHEVPYEEVEGVRKEILPDADVIVDPKRMGDTYPYKEICGAFVAMKCIQILFDLAREKGLLTENQTKRTMDEIIAFAAFGTICDVMPLLDENRILVREGLKLINASVNLGLQALIDENKLSEMEITGYHIGFVLGPCLNASGRLDSAKKGLMLFETDDMEASKKLATELVELNRERKELTEKGVEDAMCQVEQELFDDPVLVVYLPDCHESIAGIIAGRVREKYNRPCMVVTKTEHGLKGSGRSIEAYHMRDGLQKAQDLLTKFGGHKLAAGFSLEEENLEPLRKRLNDNADLTQDDFVKEIMLDIDLPIQYADIGFIEEIKRLQPYGTQNEAPLFGRNDLSVEQIKVVGKNKNVAKCVLKNPSGYKVDAVFFGEAEVFERDMQGASNGLLIAYYPDFNEYNGVKKVQLVIKYYMVK